jgi:hypothetical protein
LSPDGGAVIRNWHIEAAKTWSDRLAEWVAVQGGNRDFLDANVATIKYWLTEHGMRVVVNAGSFALGRLLEGDRYKNRYELGRIGGAIAPPSARRLEVDGLLGFTPDGRDWYFGAVAVGGTGVRFYGEYCLVLKKDARSSSDQFLDRNSYDLKDPPLSNASDASIVVKALRTTWDDLPVTIATKVLSAVTQSERLLTVGIVSELTLRDEDFVEVHLHRPGCDGQRSFGIESIEEVRQSPDEVALHQHLLEQQMRGRMLTPAESEWCSRRAHVEELLDRARVPSRVVTTNGRGARWR